MSKVKHRPASSLQCVQPQIKVSGFLIELLHPRTQLAQFCDPSRVILENMANSISGRLSGRVELRGLDQMRGQFNGLASHNGHYIKSAPEALPCSGAD